MTISSHRKGLEEGYIRKEDTMVKGKRKMSDEKKWQRGGWTKSTSYFVKRDVTIEYWRSISWMGDEMEESQMASWEVVQ